MAAKTVPTAQSVEAFLESIPDARKREESKVLIERMEALSGQPAVMWGPSIIGFGSYHYKYKSGHEGDAPLIGFSPRKAAFSLYIHTGLEEHKHLLEGLGTYKMSVACIYVKKLSDIDLTVMDRIIVATMAYLNEQYNSTTGNVDVRC